MVSFPSACDFPLITMSVPPEVLDAIILPTPLNPAVAADSPYSVRGLV